MRLVQIRDGVLEVRWTWLPFWMATNPKLKEKLEEEMRDAISMGGVSESEPDLDSLHDYVVRRLQEMFPTHPGLGELVDGLKYVQEPV